MFTVPAGPRTKVCQRRFFTHSYCWGAEAHSPRHSFLLVGCRDLASRQYPPHLRLRSTACFRPFSAPFYLAVVPHTTLLYYITQDPIILHNVVVTRYHTQPLSLPSPCNASSRAKCHFFSPSSEVVSARARRLSLGKSLRSDPQRLGNQYPYRQAPGIFKLFCGSASHHIFARQFQDANESLVSLIAEVPIYPT